MTQLYYSSLNAKMKAQREEQDYSEEAQAQQLEAQKGRFIEQRMQLIENRNLSNTVSKLLKTPQIKKEFKNTLPIPYSEEKASIGELVRIANNLYPKGFNQKQTALSILGRLANTRGFTGNIELLDNSELDKFYKQFTIGEVLNSFKPLADVYASKVAKKPLPVSKVDNKPLKMTVRKGTPSEPSAPVVSYATPLKTKEKQD